MSYLRQALLSLARVSDTPERTALAFAIGVFYGFCPFLGLHTFLGVATSLIFRMNKVAMMMGVWSNLPWLVVPYYAFATWVGIQILGMPEGITLPQVGFLELFHVRFWADLATQWRLLIPAFFGSTLLSVLLALAAYPFALWVIRRYREEPG